jgi:hypothetical protein
MLTDAEKVNVRRYCGYPVAGSTSPGVMSSYRFLEVYGLMEFRLNHLAAAEETALRTYLTQLAALEAAILTASENLDTSSASVWTHNPNEQRDRDALYDGWRRRLCGFLGIPPGPDLKDKRIRVVL